MLASLLPQIQLYLTQYGLTVVLILGDIGNAFVIYFFKKQHQSSCSKYLLNAAIMNIIFLSFNVPLLVYAYISGDPSSQSFAFCQIARYSVVLACIDRFAFTSQRTRIRNLSQPNIARHLMIIISSILFLCAVHIVIMTTIMNGRCGQFPPYYMYYASYMVIFVSIIPPVMMAIFGYLAYKNVRLSQIRAQLIRNTIQQNYGNIAFDRRDRELLKMVLAEVIMYVISMKIYPVILTEVAITNYMSIQKSADYMTIENFIVFIGIVLGTLNSAVPFYIYIVVSKVFRKHVMKLLKCSRDQK